MLCQVPRNCDVAGSLVEDFDPDESFPGHHRLHEPKIEAPHHNNSKDDGERSHDNPVLDVVDAEYRAINAVVNSIVVFVLDTIRVGFVLSSNPVVLL